MNSTTKAIIAAAFAVVVSVGLIFWQSRYGGAHAMTSLTPEDMTLLTDTFPPAEQLKLCGEAGKNYYKINHSTDVVSVFAI